MSIILGMRKISRDNLWGVNSTEEVRSLRDRLIEDARSMGLMCRYKSPAIHDLVNGMLLLIAQQTPTRRRELYGECFRLVERHVEGSLEAELRQDEPSPSRGATGSSVDREQAERAKGRRRKK